MTEAAVYWFTDHGGLLMPEKAYVEYYDEASGAFVNAGDIGTQADRFNVLPLPEVLSRRIRISMYHSTQSTGIVEFRVKGTVPVPTPFAAFGSRVGDGEWETGVGHRTVARGRRCPMPSASTRHRPCPARGSGRGRMASPRPTRSSPCPAWTAT